jgi:putative sigma-54 modulation protein
MQATVRAGNPDLAVCLDAFIVSPSHFGRHQISRSNAIPMPTSQNNPSAGPRIIVRCEHFELTPALQTAAEEKAARLLRHEEHIIRIRVDLEHDRTRNPGQAFAAKGHIEIRGPDLIARVESDEPLKSLDALIDVLDGLLRKRASAAKTKRHHPHGVDIPSNLPKVE